MEWLVTFCLPLAVSAVGGVVAGFVIIKFNLLPNSFSSPSRFLRVQTLMYITWSPSLLMLGWPGGVGEPSILISVLAYAVGLFTIWFLFGGGGGKWRRVKQKMSAAKEKLLAKVRELAPAPSPGLVPIPVRG